MPSSSVRGEGRRERSECIAGAALLALQMVEAVLEKQDQFISIVRQHNWSVMVTPLSQLLLGINPRTGKADHLVNIASYVALPWASLELALSAVRILHGVCHSPKSAKEMAVAISNNKEVQSVLEVVVERNSVLQNLHGNSHLFESWRQLVEVMLHALVQGGVREEGKVAVLLELTQDLLLKVQPTKGSGLAGAVYGVLLVLTAHLRQTVATAVADDNGL